MSFTGFGTTVGDGSSIYAAVLFWSQTGRFCGRVGCVEEDAAGNKEPVVAETGGLLDTLGAAARLTGQSPINAS